MVKPVGLLVVDHYIWRINYYINPASYWRILLRRLSPVTSNWIVDRLVNFFFPLHWTFRYMAAADWLVKRFSPLITFIKTNPELSREEQLEWARLDTYD